eukprot:TRINITY_DN40978_c0_g1_i1.p1 TRINITY_DN40978_c0_g1~~TRINITY_DN40978_c0_g1_i1.p1  ORF type:complete len:108 (-),score=5.27 TRINITY_DN40978_c0_g1_i1:156-479(-)
MTREANKCTSQQHLSSKAVHSAVPMASMSFAEPGGSRAVDHSGHLHSLYDQLGVLCPGLEALALARSSLLWRLAPSWFFLRGSACRFKFPTEKGGALVSISMFESPR